MRWVACYWKPVQSGLEGETDSETVAASRPDTIRAHLPRGVAAEDASFAASCGQNRRCPRSFRKRCPRRRPQSPLIIEGAGGAAGPLDGTSSVRRCLCPLADTGHPLRPHADLARSIIRCCHSKPCAAVPFRFSVSLSSATNRRHARHHRRNSGRCDCLGRLPLLDPLTPDTLAAGLSRPFRSFLFSESVAHEPSPVWHPFTQHALEPAMKRIVRTEGAYLLDEQGHAILDAISSWWVITHGHRHPAIMDAIRRASETLRPDHLCRIYPRARRGTGARAGRHRAGRSRRMCSIPTAARPAVEVALKMALGFFHNSGAPRSRIVVMEHGYHGDTIGTMSAGERGVFNAAYEPMLFGVDRLPFPAPGHEQDTLDAFERFCRSGQVAALLIEPLILGAGGMRMYPAWLLTELKAIADKAWQPDDRRRSDDRLGPHRHPVCLRAGEHHAGYPVHVQGADRRSLPLAATLVFGRNIRCAPLHRSQPDVLSFEFLYRQSDRLRRRGWPILPSGRRSRCATRIQLARAMHADRLERFEDGSRALPMCVKPARSSRLTSMFRRPVIFPMPGRSSGPSFAQRNLLIRPLGNVIYLMTPYCVTAEDLDRAYDAIDEAANLFCRRDR